MEKPRRDFLLERAESAAEAAKSADSMGFSAIAKAYREAERLWLAMAEQAERNGH